MEAWLLGVYIIDFNGEHGEKAEKFKIIFIAIVARRASGEETGVSFNVSLPIATSIYPSFQQQHMTPCLTGLKTSIEGQ